VTLVEFIAPVRDKTTRDKCLAILYYSKLHMKNASLTTEGIREALIKARIPKAKKLNVADVMNKGGSHFDSDGFKNDRLLWRITGAGEEYIQRLLNLPNRPPDIEHDVNTLETLARGIQDPDAREYVEEANKCLKAGALRAGIVFIWAGAIRTIQSKCLSKNLAALNGSLIRHDSKARTVSGIDDFQYVKDKNVLLVAEDVGVLDKAERSTMSEALDLRNRCGHPNKYRPGIKKASSFIEDVMGIAFR
jgi:hypothetical protein